MGDIKSAQIALDPDLSSHLGDAGRRDLLYQVKQDASRFTNPQDELITAMISLARRTEANMAAAPKPALPALEADNPESIPEANITILETEETPESHLHVLMKLDVLRWRMLRASSCMSPHWFPRFSGWSGKTSG